MRLLRLRESAVAGFFRGRVCWALSVFLVLLIKTCVRTFWCL